MNIAEKAPEAQELRKDCPCLTPLPTTSYQPIREFCAETRGLTAPPHMNPSRSCRLLPYISLTLHSATPSRTMSIANCGLLMLVTTITQETSTIEEQRVPRQNTRAYRELSRTTGKFRQVVFPFTPTHRRLCRPSCRTRVTHSVLPVDMENLPDTRQSYGRSATDGSMTVADANLLARFVYHHPGSWLDSALSTKHCLVCS